jgi:uncharacterized protein YcbX
VHLAQLWRHPVKSFQGELLDTSLVEDDGLQFDRSFGIIDRSTGKILTARRNPTLLFGRAHVSAAGELTVSVPRPGAETAETREFPGMSPELDAALSEWLGLEVALMPAKDHPAVSAENFDNALDESGPVHDWQLPEGRFVDSAPLLLITTATLESAAGIYPEGRWDVRRFRPNLVVDAQGTSWLEDSWRNLVVRVGEAELSVRKPCTRCTMVTRAQPGIPADQTIFRSLAHEHGATFGVLCDVRTPGIIHVGDELELLG